MSLTLRWRAPDRPVVTRWRGPDGMVEALTRNAELPVAAIIGPPGPSGSGSGAAAPVRIDASLAATWILSHSLGRIPTVQVYLTGDEPVIADVAVTTSQITVTFPSPQQGFVLAF
ncbi:MAG: hypothetical protein AB7F98_02550 [Novosphingobium sp.]